MRSLLEEHLLTVTPQDKQRERDIDLLRSVLTGELGTTNQRNALLRIISAVKPQVDVHDKLNSQLLALRLPRRTYERNANFIAIETQPTE